MKLISASDVGRTNKHVAPPITAIILYRTRRFRKVKWRRRVLITRKSYSRAEERLGSKLSLCGKAIKKRGNSADVSLHGVYSIVRGVDVGRKQGTVNGLDRVTHE